MGQSEPSFGLAPCRLPRKSFDHRLHKCLVVNLNTASSQLVEAGSKVDLQFYLDV